MIDVRLDNENQRLIWPLVLFAGGRAEGQGRTLTDEDLDHYQKIVVSLHETIWIMAEIDEVIERYGGWPGAFTSSIV